MQNIMRGMSAILREGEAVKMSYNTNYRIYDKVWRRPAKRRIGKGLKKKARRMLKACCADGWERKQANSLAPQHYSAKRIFREEG